MNALNQLGLPFIWTICCTVAAWQGRVTLWAVFAIPPFVVVALLWAYSEFFDRGQDPFGVKNLLEIGVIVGATVIGLSGLGLHVRRKSVSGTRPAQGS